MQNRNMSKQDMQVSIETMNGLERRMTIVVASETFEQQINERLRASAQRARLAGFRPGKVPVKEIRRRFGKAVRQEVAGELMQSSFFEAIRRESLSPAGQPSLDVLRMEPGEDFEFAATFEVFPPIDLQPMARVAVNRPSAEIADGDVDTMIETLREQRKQWDPVERPAADGDRVRIDFVGRIDGEPFEGGTGKDVAFVLGARQMIDDFDKGVRGAAPGAQVVFDATFPDDYRAEKLAGKTVQFDVTVNEVAAPRMPDLDDDFFKAFGVETGGLEAFRAEVRNNMQRELDTAVRSQLKRQVMDELKRLHEFQLPQAMVMREIGALKQQMAQQLHGHDHDHDHDHDHSHGPDLPDELFRDEAARRVKVGLLINEIIRSKEMVPDPARVRSRIEDLAKAYVQPEQVVNWYYGNQERLAEVEMAVLEDQVVDYILEQAKVSELRSSYEDIISGRAVAEPDDASSPT
jgi:trigger factor